MATITTKFDVNDVVAFKTSSSDEMFGRIQEVKKNKDGIYYAIKSHTGTTTVPEDQVLGSLEFTFKNSNVKMGQPA